MKRFIFYLAFFLPLLSAAQNTTQAIAVNKLVIDSKKTFNFIQGDSTTSVVIDTLVMNDKSKLFFTNKKNVNLVIKHALIGKNCVIAGNDSKNNGTNLKLVVNFERLGSLFILVQGEDAKLSNRNFDNGNGGNVELSYLRTGKMPQTANKNKSGYVAIENRAGGYSVNAQTDIATIMDQVRRGSPGRPLSQLPNGRVYSGSIGRDGTVTINAVDHL